MMSTHDALELKELPLSDRTLTIGDEFMISDNLDSSDPMAVLNFPSVLKVKVSAPFRLRFSIVLLCLGGSMRIHLNMMEYLVKRNDMLIVPEGTIGECLMLSDDAKIVIMAFARDFMIQDGVIRPMTGAFASVLRMPLIHLEDYETEDVMSMYNMLRTRVADSRFMDKRELAILTMKTMYCYVSSHFRLSELETQFALASSRIFERFIELVEVNFARQRQLKFYAAELGVPPKYLSKVVLEVSGRSAKSWIMERVMLEAKVLIMEDNMSVLEISERLGFPNQSFFGTYFKKAAGVSPAAYKKDKCLS